MKTEIENDEEIYKRQFELSNELIGKTISEIVFYLEDSDIEYTEQPNEFGKSLLHGIDIRTKENKTYSIGNRFTNLGYGLRIDQGSTEKIEHFSRTKTSRIYKSEITGANISKVNIYWMQIPFENEKGIYPQEIEILSANGYFLISSIEVNDGEINTEFTNELLILEEKGKAKELNLGRFGQSTERLFFKDIDELMEQTKTGYNK